MERGGRSNSRKTSLRRANSQKICFFRYSEEEPEVVPGGSNSAEGENLVSLIKFYGAVKDLWVEIIFQNYFEQKIN